MPSSSRRLSRRLLGGAAAALLAAVVALSAGLSGDDHQLEAGAAQSRPSEPIDSHASDVDSTSSEQAASSFDYPTTPSSDDINVITAELSADEIFEPGRRIPLNAERVRCTYGDDTKTQSLSLPASTNRLAETITRETFTSACRDALDERNLPSSDALSPSAVCGNDDSTELTVDTMSSDCKRLGRTSSQLTNADLKRINQRRVFEIAALAVPSSDACPTARQAASHVESLLTKWPGDLNLEVRDEGSQACHRPIVWWDDQRVIAAALGPQTAGATP